MELVQLKYFKTVARLQHLTKASEELNITQPALSKAISKLEKELGIQLFSRGSNSIILNPSGEYFLEFVNRAISELELGVENLARRNSMLAGSVTIAVACPEPVRPVVKSFLDKYPQFSFHQYRCANDDIPAVLESREADIGIATSYITSTRTTWNKLARDKIVLSVPPSHPFSGKESVALNELENQRLVICDTSIVDSNTIISACRRAGFQPRISFEINDITIAEQLVQSGNGIAFVSKLSYFGLPENKNTGSFIRIDGNPFNYDIGLVTMKNYPFSSATRVFYDFIAEWFQTD